MDIIARKQRGYDKNARTLMWHLNGSNEAGESRDKVGQDIAILFDELGVYADKWCHHPTASGGMAPQEIFEACLNRPGKICFVGFVQRELGEFVKNYSPEVQSEFQKWAGRMHTDATYHLVSNLEEVISKLLIKKPEWKRIIEDFAPRLLEESSVSRESIQRYYENWEANHFYNTIAKNCFPPTSDDYWLAVQL